MDMSILPALLLYPSRIKKFFADNILITFLFLFSTSFYILQHATGYSWDFSTYVLNARFAAGSYFEWFRPPLASFAILLLGFAGLFTEYLYIIFVSFLHLFSVTRFAKAYNIDKTVFYTLSLTAFTYIFAFRVGTELFSLALLQLFLSYLKTPKAGIFLALAVLLRYPNAIYLPLLLFQRDIKKIVLSIFFFALVSSPWLVYNNLYTGDALTSIADSYAINFVFRRGVYEMPLNVFDIVIALNILLPLSLLGLARRRLGEREIILIALAALTVISYASVPLKYPRFLFALIIPAAYFATFAAGRFRNILVEFATVSIILVFLLLPASALEDPTLYRTLAKDRDCATQSNAWVPLNYFGRMAEPFPYREALNDSVKDGYRVVLIKNITDPAYIDDGAFLHSFPIIEETGDYIILGDKKLCRAAEKYDKTFLQRQNEFYSRYKQPINLTPLEALLSYSIK